MTEHNEQNDKDFPADSDGVASQGAQPVCSQCFQPGSLLQYYCQNCDSNEPLNPLASYMPFVRIRFGAGVAVKLWRMVWDDDTSTRMWIFSVLLIVIGTPIMLFLGGSQMMAIVVPVILTVGLPLLLASKIKNTRLRKIVTVAFIVLLTVLLVIYLTFI